ncbi:MAG TPA: hypothetical protein VGJ16_10635 [Pirellulales bacterium]|jgi:hypothetical protein
MAIETPARIAVIGAGPIGLETALYARYLGYDVDIYERGRVADHVLRWGHVRMFTPFGENRSALGLAALRAQDASWTAPDDSALLTGREFAQGYLLPLAGSDLLADSIREHTEVIAIGRDGPSKGTLLGHEARDESELRLLLRSEGPDGHIHEEYALADAVIDASGAYGTPNWLGPGGLPAIGELMAREHIQYGLPDVLGAARERFASRNTLLVGDSLAAAMNLVSLAELATQAPDTWVTWITPGAHSGPLSTDAADPYAERQRFVDHANRLAADDANHVTHYAETFLNDLSWHAGLDRFHVKLAGKHGGEFEFDQVIGAAGWHADEELYRVLHVRPVDLLESGQTPGSLLIQPEPDFYVLGAKSFGHDPAFTIREGLNQIRELFKIIGDRQGLDLYASVASLA